MFEFIQFTLHIHTSLFNLTHLWLTLPFAISNPPCTFVPARLVSLPEPQLLQKAYLGPMPPRHRTFVYIIKTHISYSYQILMDWGNQGGAYRCESRALRHEQNFQVGWPILTTVSWASSRKKMTYCDAPICVEAYSQGTDCLAPWHIGKSQ
jgi:hypothetical protein